MAIPPIPAQTALSAATNGDETKLFLSLDGTTWTQVAEITEIPDLPSGEQSTYETTHMNSGRFKEFKKNRRVEGVEIEMSGNLTLGSTGLETLLAAEAAGGAIPYRMDLVQGEETWNATGNALFYSLQLSNPMDEVRKFTITMKPVDEMTLAEAA